MRIWRISYFLLLCLVFSAGSLLSKLQEEEPPLASLPKLAIPQENPQTPEKIELGRRLFTDPRLSQSGVISCATCHIPEKGFTDGLPRALGHGGKELGRNSMTLLNAAYAKALAWDGKAVTLEQQALQPILNPEEMAIKKEDLIVRISGDAAYREEFRKVFGKEGVTLKTISRAIAAYERTLITGDSPLDRYLKGESGALSSEALRGLDLFKGKAGCIRCHNGPMLADDRFYNIGVPLAGGWKTDPGRQYVDGNPESWKKFKTPTLRNVGVTGPYMHNGAFTSLMDVIRFYNRGGDLKQGKDAQMKPLHLSKGEMEDLAVFLNFLTGPYKSE